MMAVILPNMEAYISAVKISTCQLKMSKHISLTVFVCLKKRD